MTENNCTVTFEGNTETSEDFVAIFARADGGADLFYHTDAMTLGIAVKMLATEFLRCWEECEGPERNEVMDILGLGFQKGIGEINNG